MPKRFAFRELSDRPHRRVRDDGVRDHTVPLSFHGRGSESVVFPQRQARFQLGAPALDERSGVCYLGDHPALRHVRPVLFWGEADPSSEDAQQTSSGLS